MRRKRGAREKQRGGSRVFLRWGVRGVCVDLTLWNRVRNEEVRGRTQVKRQLSGRVNQCVPRWFGYVE